MDSTISAAIINGICIIISAALAAIITYFLAKKRYTEKKNYPSGITYSERACDYGEKALQATNSIFSSGIFMAMLADYRVQNDFINVNSEIPITFVMVNSDHQDILKLFDMLNGWSNNETENERTPIIESVKLGVKRIRDNRKKNINIKYNNFIVSSSYFAVDYKVKTKYSFIQIKHYLLNDKKAVKVLYYTVLPSSDLWKHYCEQIRILEESNENFSNWS